MDWKAKREAVLAEAGAIVDKAKAEERGLSEDETKQFDAKMAEADRLAGTIEREEKLARTQAQASEAEARGKAPAHQEIRQPEFERAEVVEAKRVKGQEIGAIIRGRALHKEDHEAAKRWAAKTYGERSPEARAMNSADFTAGGALVPEYLNSAIIEALSATAIMRRLPGVTVVPMQNGSLPFPRVTGTPTGSWFAEGGYITKSEATVGALKLIEKDMGVVVPISNKLMRIAVPQTDQAIFSAILTSLTNTEDIGFLRGTGLENAPKGLRYWAPSAHVDNSGGTALANVRSDLRACVSLLDADNVPEPTRAWIMAPRSKNYVQYDLVDGNSVRQFASLDNGMLYGLPAFTTNNIPTNLSGDGDESEVYLVCGSEIVIGDAVGLQIAFGDNYYDGTAVVSAFSRDETAVRVLKGTDLAMKHAEAVAVRTAVTWGA